MTSEAFVGAWANNNAAQMAISLKPTAVLFWLEVIFSFIVANTLLAV